MKRNYKYCIIVAGGKGLRMGSDLPKQFMLLAKKPVIYWSIEAFHNYDPVMPVFLVLPKDYFDHWKKLVKQYPMLAYVSLVSGGESRYHSVKNAADSLPDTGIVAIHDAARPFPGAELISRLFAEAEKKGNAIPYIPVTDTLRKIENETNFSVSRDEYVRIQTPQLSDIQSLKKAFRLEWQENFTDESNMLEALGKKVNLVKGDPSNLKITDKTDLELAAFLLNKPDNGRADRY